jgi:hypothetical protein
MAKCRAKFKIPGGMRRPGRWIGLFARIAAILLVTWRLAKLSSRAGSERNR